MLTKKTTSLLLTCAILSSLVLAATSFAEDPQPGQQPSGQNGQGQVMGDGHMFNDGHGMDDGRLHMMGDQGDHMGKDDHMMMNEIDPKQYSEDVAAQLQHIQKQMDEGEAFLNKLKDLKIDEKLVTDAISNLSALITKGRETVAKMQEKLTAGVTDPQALDEYWKIMDNMKSVVQDNMKLIAQYLNAHPDLLPNDKEILKEWVHDGPKGGPGHGRGHDQDLQDTDFKDFKPEDQQKMKDFFQNLGQAVYMKMSHKMGKEMMGGMSQYFNDKGAKDIMSHIMGSIDTLGDDATAKMIQEKQQLFGISQKLDFKKFDKFKDNSGEKMRALMDHSQKTIIPDESKDKVSSLWTDLKDSIAAGADKDTLSAKMKTIEDTMKQIDHDNVFGANPVEFLDVKFEDAPWYWGAVMAARKKGIINGYSDNKGLTGFFKPGNPVTYAEALKMSLEASGQGISHENPPAPAMVSGSATATISGDTTPPSVTAPNAPWQQAYLDKLDTLNLPKLTSKTYADWTKPATRADIVLIVDQVFGIQSVKYVDGTFKDVKTGDAFADDAMAAYLAGVFTGEGDTGNLNPTGQINRASFAKVIGAVLTYKNGGKITDQLAEFDKQLK